MNGIHHKWQQPDPSYPAITWPLLPRHAMLRGHRHKHANLSPGVNIECVGEGGRVSTAHVFQCVFHVVKDPWKTQWKTCYFSVFCLKDVPTNDKRNVFVFDFLYDATSFIQSIENSHVFHCVFHGSFMAWKTQWKTQRKTCVFSVLCLKDVPTNDKINYICFRVHIRGDVFHTKYWDFARLSMGLSGRLSRTTQGRRTSFNGCHDGRDADIVRRSKRNRWRKVEFLQHAAGWNETWLSEGLLQTLR